MDARLTRAITMATVVGTVAQVAMVVAGHYHAEVAALFAVLGMAISLAAGAAVPVLARGAVLSRGGAAGAGAVAGGVCALLGIAVSYALGDVPAAVLAFGTASSAVTGALGGLLGRWRASAQPVRA